MLVVLTAIFLIFFYTNYVKKHPPPPAPAPVIARDAQVQMKYEKYCRIMIQIAARPWTVWQEHLLGAYVISNTHGRLDVMWSNIFPMAGLPIQHIFSTAIFYPYNNDDVDIVIPANLYDMFSADDWYREKYEFYYREPLHVKISVVQEAHDFEDFRINVWLRAIDLLFTRFSIVVDQTIF